MAALARPTTRTVLVADDTAFVRDRFKGAIEGGGHKAVTVRSAPELLGYLRASTSDTDLIVLDFRLPQGNGLNLLRSIRALERSPIVVFTGTIANAEEVGQLDTFGVVGYVNEYCGSQHIFPSLAPYLFRDSSNRRSSPRVALGIPISYRFGNTIAGALTLNISHGGVAIRTASPLPVDTAVQVRLRLPTAPKDIDTRGRVAWADRRRGMGVTFEDLTPIQQVQVDDYVRSHFFSNRKA